MTFLYAMRFMFSINFADGQMRQKINIDVFFMTMNERAREKEKYGNQFNEHTI